MCATCNRLLEYRMLMLWIRTRWSLTRYLQTELLDRHANQNNGDSTQVLTSPSHDPEAFGFHNATFAWSQSLARSKSTPGRRNFRLRIDGDLFFQKGKINLILGPTGSGKTSMLLALLGELHFMPSPDSWYNLPRGDGVAYAAQEPWVQNETIKVRIFEFTRYHVYLSRFIQDNILFGQKYDAERYRKGLRRSFLLVSLLNLTLSHFLVLYQCALEPDLALFEVCDKVEFPHYWN